MWLLDHGADPNQQCAINLTPLSWAVACAPVRVIKTMFDRGADVQKGEPLQHAIDRETDIVEVLSLLLEKGAPLNKTMYQNDYQSWRLYFFMGLGTPLHKAADQGKVDAVQYLLGQGADTTIKDARGWTALDYARDSNHPDVVKLLEDVRAKL